MLTVGSKSVRCFGGARTLSVVQRRLMSSDSNSPPSAAGRSHRIKKNGSIAPVYVHPLSQIVLMYLQNRCHAWIAANQVDKLKIQRDGTFVLDFPDGSARIWTFYDPMDKKHWLSFRKHQVQHRFLLQDNLLPAWNGNKRQSLPERIQNSVQELLRSVDELEEMSE